MLRAMYALAIMATVSVVLGIILQSNTLLLIAVGSIMVLMCGMVYLFIMLIREDKEKSKIHWSEGPPDELFSFSPDLGEMHNKKESSSGTTTETSEMVQAGSTGNRLEQTIDVLVSKGKL